MCTNGGISSAEEEGGSGILLEAVQFSQRLADPQLWVRKAEELLAAARLLEPEIQAQWAEVKVEGRRITRTSGRINIQGPYFVLIAYAVENLFKAPPEPVERPPERQPPVSLASRSMTSPQYRPST